MQEKADLLTEIDELKEVKDELTSQVFLHVHAVFLGRLRRFLRRRLRLRIGKDITLLFDSRSVKP